MRTELQLCIGFALLGVVHPFDAPRKPPHLVFILADDMGWNDVSFHGSDQIPTPSIDSLAYHGVILNRHYVQPLCTPSRTALMTGKYPVHTGIHEALYPSDKAGLNLSEKILPEYLKDRGYATHIVGKWHLGFRDERYTPLRRGFDSHFGYFTGAISYYDHICQDLDNIPPYKYPFSGHDFRRNYTVAWDLVGHYATDLFTREAVRVIHDHPLSTPLFLYLSHLAPHAGNQGKWLEAPQEEINRFLHISDPNRRTFAAMVSRLDKSIGAVIEALESRRMLDNSIIVFMSDNGAPVEGVYNNWGSNYPWRGQKATLWEGGVRTPAAIWSPLIRNPSRVSYDLMHITDWLPTLLAATGYGDEDLAIDGVSQWLTISQEGPSPRNKLVIDIDQAAGMTAVIVDNYKYLRGPTKANSSTDFSTFLDKFSLFTRGSRYTVQELASSPTWKILQKHSPYSLLEYRVEGLRQEATVSCPDTHNTVPYCDVIACLFDVAADPCETTNIAHFHPDVVRYMETMIQDYEQSKVEVQLGRDAASNPYFFCGSWSPWEVEGKALTCKRNATF